MLILCEWYYKMSEKSESIGKCVLNNDIKKWVESNYEEPSQDMFNVYIYLRISSKLRFGDNEKAMRTIWGIIISDINR